MEKNKLIDENMKIEKNTDNREALTEIMKRTIFSALKITNSQYCYISFYNRENNQTAIIAASQNHLNNRSKDFLTFSLNGQISLWKWIIENLIETKNRRKNEEAIKVNRASTLTHQIPVPVDKFLTLPVTFKDKLYGQIAIASFNKHYSNEDILVLQKIASQLSLEIFVIDSSRNGV